MEQVQSLKELISAALGGRKHTDSGVVESLLTWQAELDAWIPKLEENLMQSRSQSYSKSFLEPLFDLIEQIKSNESIVRLFNLPPESEWGGVVPNFCTFAGLHNTSLSAVKSPEKFNVRGATYLQDNVKVQSPSALFHLRAVQLLSTPNLVRHVASCSNWCALPNNPYKVLSHGKNKKNPLKSTSTPTSTSSDSKLSAPSQSPTTDVNNNIDTNTNTTGVITDDDVEVEVDPIHTCGWATALKRFWKAEKEYCDQRFKLIPSVVQGPWAIKLAVGTKPALIGTKLALQYFRGDGYLEVDIDLGSSTVATKILAMVRDVSKMLTVDMAVTIQGNERDELPERILCQSRFVGMDFSKAKPMADGETL
eukprot:gene3115-6122_t